MRQPHAFRPSPASARPAATARGRSQRRPVRPALVIERAGCMSRVLRSTAPSCVAVHGRRGHGHVRHGPASWPRPLHDSASAASFMRSLHSQHAKALTRGHRRAAFRSRQRPPSACPASPRLAREGAAGAAGSWLSAWECPHASARASCRADQPTGQMCPSSAVSPPSALDWDPSPHLVE
jgi:hypothetical protein